jgi:hypothetical protein
MKVTGLEVKNIGILEERPHHPRSPSKLQCLEACPDFDSKTDGLVHRRSTAGTRAHKVVDSQEDNAQLGDDDALAVAECLDFVATRRAFMQEQAQEAYTKGDDWAVNQPVPAKYQIQELKETYLPIDDCKYEDADCTTGGYIDHGFISWDELYAELVDYKFGFWAVESAENNLQGIAYTLGLFRRFAKLQKVRFWFKQPHLDYITDAVFTREQAPELYRRVKTVCLRAIEAKHLGDFSLARQFTPVCLFCDHLGRCPANLATALGVAKKFHPLAFPESITPTQIQDPQNTKLAMELAQVMAVWTGAFKRQVTNRVLRGDAKIPPGYKIETTSGRRKIKDLAKFKEVALKYLNEEEYQACLEASFGTLEDKILEKTPRGYKEATVEEFQKALEEAGAVERGDSYSFLRQLTEKSST